MARKRSRVPLNVFLNGRLVGRLHRQSSGAIDFTYDAGWLGWENAIPVSLSLPLREKRYVGEPVFAVFDNLLPDNEDIRSRVAARSGADGDDAYSLLARIGRDCVGALQFLPDGEDPGPAGAIEGRPVDDAEVAEILRNLASAPLGAGRGGEFRISIAGTQEKTALLRHEGQWLVPHGTTATTHILKPAIGMRSDGLDLTLSVANEHFCLLLAKEFGISSATTEIAVFEDRKVLIVERFDRFWTRDGRLLRRPQEDFCQVLSIHPAKKYESDGGPGIEDIIGHLGASDEPEADRRTFLKAHVLFWLLGATDGHAKNFSVFLGPGGRFSLTPLYDVMSAQPNVDAKQIAKNKYKLAMAVGDKHYYQIERIAPRHFRQTAARCGLPAEMIDGILQGIMADAPKAIDAALAALPADFPQSVADSIVKGVRWRLKILELEPASVP